MQFQESMNETQIWLSTILIINSIDITGCAAINTRNRISDT